MKYEQILCRNNVMPNHSDVLGNAIKNEPYSARPHILRRISHVFRTLLTFFALCILPLWSAQAEPVLKIVNFTAEWCPNCQTLNPEINAALKEFPAGEIELVNLDMTTAGRGASDYDKSAAFADAIRLADSHQAAYLWAWYGGATGIAAIISADNGEPIACMNRLLDADDIEARLREATIISLRRAPGDRMPEGPDCPPPLN